MRILITGFVVFVIWSLFAVWLYVTRLQPAIRGPLTEQTIEEPVPQTAEPPAQPAEILPAEVMVYFEFDKSRFTPDPQTEKIVAEYKAWIDKHPESAVVVSGHTDNIGPGDYNQKLGLRRAEAVKEYLEANGITSGRINISSEGEDRPLADNTTGEGRAKNRRAEISIK